MRKKARRLIMIFLSLMLILMNGTGYSVKASGNDIVVPDPEIIILVPGETQTVRIPIQSVRDIIQKPVVMADSKDAPFTLSQPKFVIEGYDLPITLITPYASQFIEVDIKVDETAKIGIYSFDLIVTGEYYTYEGGNASATLTISAQVLEEREPAQLTVNKVTTDDQTIGKNMNLSFTVKNDGEITARSVFVSADYADTGMIAGYSTKNIKVDNIEKQKEVLVKLPIRILPTATPGLKVLTININYKVEDGTEFKESHDVYLDLRENDDAPNLILQDYSFDKSAKQGDKLGLNINIRNSGDSVAINPRISVDESSIGTSKFIKDYYTDYIEFYNIKSYTTKNVKIPLIISKEIIGGLKEIKLNLEYFDEEGVEYKSTVTIYPEIEADGISEDGTPVVIISNVKQSPEIPVGGGKLQVSFDMKNKSSIDLNDFKIKLKNLTGNTFVPVSSDPYQYVGSLKAGETSRITIPLTVSENIQEGLNTLSIEYSYAGGGAPVSEDIPILDVQNDLGSASKPRIIVSKYEADIEELRAGSVFNFNFEVRNTHSSVAAKNIIISISGKSETGQEVFTVTQGSNSFFVNKIGAGETYSETLEMKVKSDTATNAYPIVVTIEYEYDGIEPNPTTGEIGETEKIDLNLQVVENARPVVDYVNVYSWDGMVTVGAPATLSFEFYNMGKSMLNNVIATVEGDFTNSSGNMFFMGNVNAGDRSYAEFEVIPNMEGMAQGVVKITYEDSNGDEQVYSKDFETSVMGEQIWEPGMDGDGGVDVFNPTVPEQKKAILSTWLFVIIQIAIFIIFIPITRKVIISVYRKRLLKKEDEKF